MKKNGILTFGFILLIIGSSAKAGLRALKNDDISVSITLSSNSSVHLTRSKNGKYAGNLHLSARQTSHQKTHVISLPIAADTVANLLSETINLGLLEITGNDLNAIDGFRTRFTIIRVSDERKFSLVTGLANKDSEKAGRILNLLRYELQVQKKLYAYLNTLPAGDYQVGMLTVKVHELAKDERKKSSLYLLYEKSFNKNRIEVPLYLINGKVVEPIELNKYEVEDMQKTEVLESGSAAALYGARAAYGVVLLTTK